MIHTTFRKLHERTAIGDGERKKEEEAKTAPKGFGGKPKQKEWWKE